VPEYEQRCHCLGRAAQKRAEQIAASRHGSLQELRKRFEEEFPNERNSSSGQAWLAWERFVEPYRTTEREVLAAQSDRDAPDIECPVCRGRGDYPSTSNPRGRWDWYRLINPEARRTEGGPVFARSVEDLLNRWDENLETPFA